MCVDNDIVHWLYLLLLFERGLKRLFQLKLIVQLLSIKVLPESAVVLVVLNLRH